MSTREGNKNGWGQGCHFGRFAQGKGCGSPAIMVIGDSRFCQKHWHILLSIVRDANREKGRHPRYRGKKVA